MFNKMHPFMSMFPFIFPRGMDRDDGSNIIDDPAAEIVMGMTNDKRRTIPKKILKNC